MDGAIVRLVVISIHALRKESDRAGYISIMPTLEFQSTLSVRRATLFGVLIVPHIVISIHALRKESDL